MARRGQEDLLREVRDMLVTLTDRVRANEETMAQLQEAVLQLQETVNGNNANQGNEQGQAPGDGGLYVDLNVERDAGPQERAQATEGTITSHMREFRKFNPSFFEGDMDPVAAEKWIDELETYFSVMSCSSEQRVQLAAFKLVGKAKHWWATVKPNTEITGVGLDWEQFKKKFFDHYFPASMKARKEAEFLVLKQGSLSEDEYINKFLDLAKYSSYLQRVNDDKWKARRLLEGARPELREKLAVVPITSFEELCDTMRHIAQRMKELQEERRSTRI